MEGEQVLLIVALAAPPAATLAALIATGRAAPPVGRRILQAGCVLAALAWAVLTTRGLVAAVGFHTNPLLAAAGCGAALLTASADEADGRRTLLCGGLALTGLVGGLAAGATSEQALTVVAGLALALALSMAGSSERRRPEALVAGLVAVAGVAAVGLGFVLVHDASGRWALPTGESEAIATAEMAAFLVGGAALAASGALRPRRSTAVLLAGGLAVGLAVSPLRALVVSIAEPGSAETLAVAVVLLGTAAAAAAAARQAPLALALMSLSVAAGPLALVGASRLIGAGAVLALAIDRRPGWLLGVPGGVALAVGATQLGTDAALVLGVAAAAVAGLLVFGPGPPRAGVVPLDVGALPAAAVGAWLLVAPGSWSWVGPTDLGPYDLGAARAVAFGLIVVVAALLAGQARARSGPTERGTQGPSGPPERETQAPPVPKTGRRKKPVEPEKTPVDRGKPLPKTPARLEKRSAKAPVERAKPAPERTVEPAAKPGRRSRADRRAERSQRRAAAKQHGTRVPRKERGLP